MEIHLQEQDLANLSCATISLQVQPSPISISDAQPWAIWDRTRTAPDITREDVGGEMGTISKNELRTIAPAVCLVRSTSTQQNIRIWYQW